MITVFNRELTGKTFEADKWVVQSGNGLELFKDNKHVAEFHPNGWTHVEQSDPDGPADAKIGQVNVGQVERTPLPTIDR